MADPGRLEKLLVSESRIWLRAASNTVRRTRWTAVLAENTRDGELDRAEVKMGRSRLDFRLSDPQGRRMALEVKSVTLVEGVVGLFPDAVTERGARHMKELVEIAGRPGWEAGVLFVLQRAGAREIRAARLIDPKFAAVLSFAREAGVRILGRRCRVFLDRVELGDSVSVCVD